MYHVLQFSLGCCASVHLLNWRSISCRAYSFECQGFSIRGIAEDECSMIDLKLVAKVELVTEQGFGAATDC